MKLIGDSKFFPKGLYNRKLSLVDSQAMVDLICAKMAIKTLRVILGRKTINRYGSVDLGKRIIIKKKPSEGVIIHELAHLQSKNHTEHYKRMHNFIAHIWDK